MKPLVLVLDNIRSAYNVGSILRTADCFAVSEVICVGYTPYPIINGDKRLPHVVQKIQKAIQKTALGAELTITIKHFATIETGISYLKTQGFRIVAVEQAPSSKTIDCYKYNQPTALIFGNEVTGLTPETLALCDMILEIRQFGAKESLNVSAAAAIALYALRSNSYKTNGNL
jgi:23S rRNA (guanosine2251-2'-O)-methyltransferase